MSRRRDPDYATLPTEAAWPEAEALDALPPHQVVDLLLRREQRTLRAVRRAAPAITRVAAAAAEALAAGGRLIYLGAGTSGRLGVLDASECPPTFGTRPEQVVGVIAGGRAALWRAVEGAEDRPQQAEAALKRLRVGARDLVVGLAASGVTPYVRGGLDAARARGASTALVTCAPDAARAAGLRADLIVPLDVGPEVLAGSTRLGAGTAQKLTLNAISTTAMVITGRAYGPSMVDLRATSVKLRARAERLVVELGRVQPARARRLLAAAGGSAKTAIVMARLGLGRAAAEREIAGAGGRLRALLGAP